MVTYAPIPGFSGPDSLLYKICDKLNPTVCDSAWVFFTITPVIVASYDNLGTVASGGTLVKPLIVNDTLNGVGNFDPTLVNITITDSPNKGTASINPTTGQVTYTPNAAASGIDSLIYRICDKLNPTVCDTALVVVSIAPKIDAVSDRPPSVASGGTLTYPLLTNDTLNGVGNFNPTLVNITTLDPADKGTASINPTTGVVTYTPTPGFSGPDSLLYKICDKLNPTVCDSAWVFFTITPVIVASYDNLGTVAAGGTLVKPLIVNDTLNGVGNFNPTLVNITITDTPNKGVASINPTTGQVTYTPNAGASGLDSLIYQICDKLNPTVCDTALVVVNIAPKIDAVRDVAGNVPSGGTLTYPLLTNDTLNGVGNFNPTLVTITIPDSPDKGTASINPTTGVVTYTPTPGFSGPDSLLYKICDKLNPTVCDSAWVFFTITPVIVASYDNLGTVAAGSTLVKPLIVNDTLNGVGNLNPTLVNITILQIPVKGTATVNPVTGVVTYVATPGFSGTDNLIYQICDKLNPAVCDTALVVVTITPTIDAVNDIVPPVASGSSVTYPLITNDTLNAEGNFDPTMVNIVTVVNPGKGTATIDANTGQVTYTPAPGQSGPDSLQYKICDKLNPTVCDLAWVYFDIIPGILANYDNLGTVAADSSVTYPILINDQLNNISPVDTSKVTITIIQNGSKGTGTINPGGTLAYVAGNAQTGVDSLIYKICDKLNPAVCDTALVVVNINAPLLLLPKVYLQGSLFGVTYTDSPTNSIVDSLMRDELRVKNLIPLTSPYSYWNPTIPANTILPTVLTTTGRNAIVDWVFVELRDSADSTKIIRSQSALVQRDGDIVSLDGVSPIQAVGQNGTAYYVAVRHRNHLAVMTAGAVPLTAAGTTIDFRQPTTPTYVFGPQPIHQSQVVVVQGRAMWAGNALRDSVVIYQGTLNDVNVIAQQVINAAGNTFMQPNYILEGYFSGDVNMNGEVIFQGTTNDVEFIYQNVIKNHPGNTFQDNFFIIQQQLPK